MGIDTIVPFLFEVGLLDRFKRSGFDFLGSSCQTIASHSFRVAIIAYILSKRYEGADALKCLTLTLFHDVPESRTGDINYFQKRYIKKHEEEAVRDIAKISSELAELPAIIDEFNNGTSIEAQIARDADALELILTLKEEADKGNPQADIWIKDAFPRLKLKESISIAEGILNCKSYDWWMDIQNVKR